MEEELGKKDLKQELKKLKLKSEKLELKIKELKARDLELKQQKSLIKIEEDSINDGGLYGTKSEPRKALSTYLRNQNKAEISFVSILDRKAAILIRICTALISGLIVFQTYIEENVAAGHLISHILIICSILATKPAGRILQRMFIKRIHANHAELEENVFFIENPNLSIQEYEQAMSKVVRSQDLQLGNQIRANYVLGVNNNLKAKILDISYNLFLVTFLIIGIVYAVNKFMH